MIHIVKTTISFSPIIIDLMMLYVGKQVVAWEEYYVKYLAKKLREIINRCTGCCYRIEIMLETALNTTETTKLGDVRVY